MKEREYFCFLFIKKTINFGPWHACIPHWRRSGTYHWDLTSQSMQWHLLTQHTDTVSVSLFWFPTCSGCREPAHQCSPAWALNSIQTQGSLDVQQARLITFRAQVPWPKLTLVVMNPTYKRIIHGQSPWTQLNRRVIEPRPNSFIHSQSSNDDCPIILSFTRVVLHSYSSQPSTIYCLLHTPKFYFLFLLFKLRSSENLILITFHFKNKWNVRTETPFEQSSSAFTKSCTSTSSIR